MIESTQVRMELFRKLFDVAPDPIFIVDRDGTIALVNEQAEKQFGFYAGELVGQKIEVLLPQRYREQHVLQRQEYAKDPTLRPMGSGRELFACRKDGSEVAVEVSLSPIESSSGLLIIGIVRDITTRKAAAEELKQANLELARSNKELEEFAYIASHDLQEPLRSIAGSCQLLRRRYGDKLDAAANEFIDFAVSGAKRMEELINDLLTYSRVSTKGKDPLLTDLNVALTKVLENLRSAITETDAQVTHDALPILAVDPWQISQLFQNLIANSLKFHGKDVPKIHIGAARENEVFHFSVRDNGIGIDPKYFDRIFVVFKRLHSREEYPGTGIGLASCKKIVERHGGKLWVESTVGQGSTFHFTINANTKEKA